MKIHDKVTIFHDPITETKLGGKAYLLRKISVLGDGLEQWDVRFLGEDGIRVRIIKLK